MLRIVHARGRVALVVAVCATATTGVAPAQALSWTGAVQGSSGDYGFGERASSLSITNGLTLSAGRLRVSASLPVIMQSDPWVTQVGAGRFPYGGPRHGAGDSVSMHAGPGHGGGGGGPAGADTGSFDTIGIGDPLMFATLELARTARGNMSLSATTGVKAPVGSVSQGFSTGEWDYGGGLALSAGSRKALLLIDAMYWKLGDMPGLELRDGISYGATVGTFVGRRRVSLLASILGSSRVTDAASAPVQLGVAVGYLSSARRSVNVGIYAGLTRSAPDISLTIGWGVPLSR